MKINWTAAGASLANWIVLGGLATVLPPKYHAAAVIAPVVVQVLLPGLIHNPGTVVPAATTAPAIGSTTSPPGF